MSETKYKPFYWLNSDSRTFLKRGYLDEGVEPYDRYLEIAKAAEGYLKIEGFADKFIDYLSRGFYSLATPVIINFGKTKGLPISCNGSYIDDTMESILDKHAEVGIMSKYGAGTSAYFGSIRPRGSAISGGGESSGSVHFMQLFDTVSNVVSQNSARRGAFAAYLPVEHADIEEFLEIRSESSKLQDINIGVTITDDWMNGLLGGDKDKRKIWGKIVQKRFETGYPYIFFHDTVNNNAPQVYKDKGKTIWSSNLCAEINLSSSIDESFVCDLSSLNLLHWDEIQKTDAIETLIYFLDAVMEEYIIKTAAIKHMQAAHNFAKRQRALGLGVLGWHSYLQSKLIAYESFEAKMQNVAIWKVIAERCDKATKELAALFGEPELLKGYGIRNVTTRAVAPTTSCCTPDTQILDSNGAAINYYKVFERAGLSLSDYMYCEVELENGSLVKLHYDSIVKVRNGNTFSSVKVSQLKDGDDIIDFSS